MRLLIAFLLAFTLVGAEDIYEGDLTADEAYEMQKLFDAKEVINKAFTEDVMKVMKMRGVDKAILVCRSGPRYQEEKMPWGGQ